MSFRITLAIVTAACLPAALSDGSPERQLEKAVYQAKVLGNLPGAIQQLDLIAGRNAGQPVAARALVELGECEERLGHTDRARNAYKRVLKDYRDDVKLVAQAQHNIQSIAESTGGPRNLSFELGETGQTPESWFVPGSLQKMGYSAELRRSGCRGTTACVVVLVPAEQPDERAFGNIMQSFSAAAFHGKTVRLHAWLRMEGAAKGDAAQMWFRVDRPDKKMGFFDNMQDRPVLSGAWTEATIVGRIDEDAQTINIGVMSNGRGRAWVDSVTFEAVPDSTRTTGMTNPRNRPKQPANLSFDGGEVAGVPKGWFTAVGKSELEHQGCRSAACASVWLPEGSKQPFGNIMQTVDAENYRGKTIRIRAWLRLDAGTPEDSAHMWFRVDRADKKTGAFDNMDDRPVTSSLWTPAEIVAKVNPDAEVLNIGVFSKGKGRAWVDGMSFEVVADGTPSTGKYLGTLQPRNLDFAQGQPGKTPDGWGAFGIAQLQRNGCRSAQCAAVWLPAESTERFANLMQAVDATPYRGKTVRLRGWLRLDPATAADTAQMWFRVDRADKKKGSFDNMDDRPVKSGSWTQAEIVAKVAADAETLNFGAFSLGKGRAWVDGMTLEVVPDSAPSTGKYQSRQ